MKKTFMYLIIALTAAIMLCGQVASCNEQGTTLCAGITATPHYQTEYQWEIGKTATPCELNLCQGENGTSHCIVSLTKDAGTKVAWIEGYVTVTNKGNVPTKDLSLKVKLATSSGTGITSANVDTSSHPVLQPGESHDYYYNINIPAEHINTGNSFKVSSDVKITDYTGHIGTPYGPSPSCTAKLPEPTLINDKVHVIDSNGMSWTCNKSGLEEYDEKFCCKGNPQDVYVNTATIQETGQSADVIITVNWEFDDPPTVDDPIVIGANSSILSPSQNQSQSQAQAQSQTSNNTNNNNLANNNTHTAFSDSSTGNKNSITNSNAPDPAVNVNSLRGVGNVPALTAAASRQIPAIKNKKIIKTLKHNSVWSSKNQRFLREQKRKKYHKH